MAALMAVLNWALWTVCALAVVYDAMVLIVFVWMLVTGLRARRRDPVRFAGDLAELWQHVNPRVRGIQSPIARHLLISLLVAGSWPWLLLEIRRQDREERGE